MCISMAIFKCLSKSRFNWFKLRQIFIRKLAKFGQLGSSNSIVLKACCAKTKVVTELLIIAIIITARVPTKTEQHYCI